MSDAAVLALAAERRRLKTAQKLFKRGPGKSGRERLEAKAFKLQVEARRLAAKAATVADRDWCSRLAEALHAIQSQ